jgi:hypothetical protein
MGMNRVQNKKRIALSLRVESKIKTNTMTEKLKIKTLRAEILNEVKFIHIRITYDNFHTKEQLRDALVHLKEAYSILKKSYRSHHVDKLKL